uniref:G-protein coupled receptors family 1 profile domain-containing protein n=1 Tax=Megaselia scalaris TaxID=36166 RepID=T1H133_MEGSC
MYNENFSTWEPLPYFFFAFHWLAMSHSCYNPLIYCYMNAMYRRGFIRILLKIPFIQCIFPKKWKRCNYINDIRLNRVNTCTTFRELKVAKRVTSRLRSNKIHKNPH